MTFDVASPQVEMALLKRVGIPSFGGLAGRSFQAQMARVYAAVTRRALSVGFADAFGQEGQDDDKSITQDD